MHRNLNFINPATRVRRAGQDCLDAMVGWFGRESYKNLCSLQIMRGRTAWTPWWVAGVGVGAPGCCASLVTDSHTRHPVSSDVGLHGTLTSACT